MEDTLRKLLADLPPLCRSEALGKPLGLTVRDIARLSREGKIPAPLKLGRKMALYDTAAVIEALVALYAEQQK